MFANKFIRIDNQNLIPLFTDIRDVQESSQKILKVIDEHNNIYYARLIKNVQSRLLKNNKSNLGNLTEYVTDNPISKIKFDEFNPSNSTVSDFAQCINYDYNCTGSSHECQDFTSPGEDSGSYFTVHQNYDCYFEYTPTYKLDGQANYNDSYTNFYLDKPTGFVKTNKYGNSWNTDYISKHCCNDSCYSWFQCK